MSEKVVTEKNHAKAYIIIVLLVSWLVECILFVNPSDGVKYFSVIMFIPAITVVILKKYWGKERKYPAQKLNLKALLFGILYPVIFIIVCAAIAEITGLGKLNSSKLYNINITVIINNILVGIFAAFGEEYGWRGYLLPELTKTKGKLKATIIVGIVWALYHVPVVFLLAKATGMSNPLFVCLIQAIVAFVFSFSFSYCYYLSGNLIPVLFLHSIWNTINTTVLGDIYTNKQGIIEGNLIYINGEAVIGLILGIIAIFWFVPKFTPGVRDICRKRD